MGDTKNKATDFGQRMLKWKEEQDILNKQQQQVIGTCIKQVVSLTSSVGGIVQPGFIDTISEQLAKGMTNEIFELRKELKITQLRFEEFKLETKNKENKRNTEMQLQLDNLKDKLERKFPAKTILGASLSPRLQTASRPIQKTPSRIPRLRGTISPSVLELVTSVPPTPSPKESVQPATVSRPRSGRSPVRNSQSSTPAERSNSRNSGRRSSVDRSLSTPTLTNAPLPSYATPTTSSKRRNSVDRTPDYQTPNVNKGRRPSLTRNDFVSTALQTPARPVVSSTGTRSTSNQTPFKNGTNSVIATPVSVQRPRRVSLPNPTPSSAIKSVPLAVTTRLQSKFVSPT